MEDFDINELNKEAEQDKKPKSQLFKIGIFTFLYFVVVATFVNIINSSGEKNEKSRLFDTSNNYMEIKNANYYNDQKRITVLELEEQKVGLDIKSQYLNNEKGN